ncbi:MAG: PAS domain S-box protein [Thermodesulfovibrionales bacterium]|nr:PAS domain S-box protein [Thermodesulfovibrionales bacterium]
MNRLPQGSILIVDDEIEILDALRDFFAEIGYETERCTSGGVALKVLEKRSFDLLITDLMMPDMSGIEVLRAAFSIDPQLIGIIITGKGSVQTAVDAMKSGAFDYLLKPLEWKLLKPVIDRAIEVGRVRRSEKKYRAIVEDQTELICRFLPDGTLTFVNEVYCRYFDKKPEELLGKSFMPLVVEEDRSVVFGRIHSLTPENPAISYEHRVRAPNRGIRWQCWTDRALFNDDGIIIQIQSVGRDITDRKLIEQALQESENRYRTIFENTGTATVIIEEDTTISLANTEYEKLSGYTREETEGKRSWAENVLAEDLEMMRQYHRLRRIDPAAAPSRYEFRFIDRSGTVKNILLAVDIIPGTRQSIASLLDITDLKTAEKNLRRAYEQVRALAAQLNEVEEKERKELVRELHDQVGQNLTALGINLNIILTEIAGKENDIILPRLEDSLMLLEQTTERIRSLMSDLRPSLMDDYGLMAVIRWFGRQFATRTGISVTVQGEELDPRFDQNVETTLFRIVQEALNNVVKHAGAQNVTITLAEKNRQIALTVTDDGRGFDTQRVYLSPEQPKWGIISMRERAEAIGGDLRVETDPGKGTRVIVEVKR